MIRLLISVAALAVATSAEAMSPAPLHEPDATQVRKARWVTWPRSKCWAACLMPALLPAKHKCIAWWDGICVEYDGTLKGWRRR